MGLCGIEILRPRQECIELSSTRRWFIRDISMDVDFLVGELRLALENCILITCSDDLHAALWMFAFVAESRRRRNMGLHWEMTYASYGEKLCTFSLVIWKCWVQRSWKMNQQIDGCWSFIFSSKNSLFVNIFAVNYLSHRVRRSADFVWISCLTNQDFFKWCDFQQGITMN